MEEVFIEKFSVKKQLRSEVSKQLGFTFAEVFYPAEQSKKIAFTLAEVFYPAEQSKKIAFTLAEVFHPAEQSRRIAFTLAEVLITLGIIGVVAALTIPTLIQNHKKTVVETRLAKFYSTMNQAIRLSEVENGDKAGWGWAEIIEDSDDENETSKTFVWLNKYLIPYLKIAKVKQNGINVLLYFTDGSLANISSESWIFYPNAKDLQTSVKYGGTKRFTFNFYPEIGIEPFQYFASAYHLKNWELQGCKHDASSTERACCAALIQKNGWKIPQDYPFKF